MIVINEARYRHMVSSPTGPVGLFLAKSGVRIESAAKALATAEQLVRSDRYRSSIAWNLLAEGTTLVLRVGSAVPYARVIERGSEPHPIFPVAARALFWTHGADRGWFVPDRPLASVRHPGTKGHWIIHRAVHATLGGRFMALG